MARLQLDRINISYIMKKTGRSLDAVRDLSFTVDDGEFVSIVGPTGCGKTSALYAIAGLIFPREGYLNLDGRPIAGPGRDRAMVFQQPALLPWRTVLRNVAYGLEMQGVARAEEQARRYVALVGLHGFEESYPNELSGGMQQRVNLARALAVEPGILLLDEPLAALDAQSREYMQVELQRIWMEQQTTALYVTHQISEALFLSDRVLVMSARPGRIKAVVPVEEKRPRRPGIHRTLPFIRLEEEIWSLLDHPLHTPSGI
jgi:NitT/TauT family transport system ATP-binding protein